MTLKSIYKYLLPLLVLCAVGYSCANRGVGPQGGPKDETPPKMVKETPANGTVNFTGKKVEILFDEYIQLDKVSENVLISPPQQRPPEVKAIGKKVTVTFDEDLQDSTTYTIDFGSAICDNNEKNAINGYSFSFSTGDVIDSLEISGLLINAEDLNPVSGIVIGIHDNLDDSIITVQPFKRIAKTDEDGYFTIHNVRPGTYRIYGLGDVSNDYLYQPGEGIALYDSLIVPTCQTTITADTLWKDSITIDTIKTIYNTTYTPDDLLLIYFKENKIRKYFQRATREQQHFFTLTFAAPQDSLPKIRLLNPADTISSDTLMITDIAFEQINPTMDTLVYWLIDSTYMLIDTLQLEMTYLKTDSVYDLYWQTDTIRAVYRAPRISEKAKQKMEQNKPEPKVTLISNAKSSFEIYSELSIRTSTPIRTLVQDSVHLFQMVDTIAKQLSLPLMPADSSYMHWVIRHNWEPDTSYKIEIDSAAFTDIYGVVNDVFSANIKTRTLDEYSSLIIKIEPYDERAMIQVLDDKDVPIRTLRAQPQGVKFEYLTPKSYYVRMYLDLNGDSVWTTGDFQTHRQPEPVYYFSSKLTLRANWDFEETFNYLDTPAEEQKPTELIKDANKKK